MRILFVGTVEFSRHCLTEVIRHGGDVVAVLTLAREHAAFHSDYADLADVAVPNGIPLHRIRRINEPQNVELIQRLRPEMIFVFGWSQLISKEILNIPSFGCLGSHPAMLPKGRGRHPIVWSLVEGLEEGGLTFFYLAEGADDGDILWQRPFPITLEDDAGSLYDKMTNLATEGIAEFMPQLERGTVVRTPQDHARATYWRKRTVKDGEINWAASTATIYNLIRALARPYLGAHTYQSGRKVKVWQAQLAASPLPPEAVDMKPGTLLTIVDGRLSVRTGDGHLTLVEHELLGGVGLELGGRLEPRT